jgi:hypothetical protein
MSTIIRRHKNLQEIEACVNIFIENYSSESELAPHKGVCRKSAEIFTKCKYVRMLEIDGVIVGGVVSTDSSPFMFSGERVLTRALYLPKKLPSKQAVTLLLDVLDDTEVFAKKRGFSFLADGSTFTNPEPYNRVLKHFGFYEPHRHIQSYLLKKL